MIRVNCDKMKLDEMFDFDELKRVLDPDGDEEVTILEVTPESVLFMDEIELRLYRYTSDGKLWIEV